MTKRTRRRRRRRKTRRRKSRRRGGQRTGPYAEVRASPDEHQMVMNENYDKLLRYYGKHAKGHSRDPFGSNSAAARNAIMSTLKKYQCDIPALQNSLLGKYSAPITLTNDYCGQGGGRRRRRRRTRRRR